MVEKLGKNYVLNYDDFILAVVKSVVDEKSLHLNIINKDKLELECD